MATYFMFGKYSPQAMQGVSAGRTKQAVDLIQKNGGKVQGMYMLLGERDLAILADFPDLESAVKSSVGLTKLTGIGFATSPALSVESFDRIVGA